MLVTLKTILTKANRGRYAVGAFNVNNLEIIQAVMAAADAERSPVVLQTSEGAIEYAGMEELAALVSVAVRKSRVPVVFHLDHGTNRELVVRAIQSGFYTSVMYDGSPLSFEENVKTTRQIVKMAHARGISVEAELGAIAGIEDFVSVSERDAHLTNPAQAGDFVRRTGCDALAVAIGTSHGAYKFSARGGSAFGGKNASDLDLKRLAAIKKAVRVPLVLHGASGVPAAIKKLCITYGCKIEKAKGVSDGMIRQAVKHGINKVNIDTDLRIAFDAGVRKFLAENPEVIDPRKILGPAKELMTKVVRQKLRLLGCSGKA